MLETLPNAELIRALLPDGDLAKVFDQALTLLRDDFVEYHHIDAWATSRRHSVAGIELRCRQHNQYAEDRDQPEA